MPSRGAASVDISNRKFSVHCLEQATAVGAEVAITFLLNFWWKIKNVWEGCKRAAEMAERRQSEAKSSGRELGDSSCLDSECKFGSLKRSDPFRIRFINFNSFWEVFGILSLRNLEQEKN